MKTASALILIDQHDFTRGTLSHNTDTQPNVTDSINDARDEAASSTDVDTLRRFSSSE